MHPDTAFLQLKQDYWHIAEWRFAFYTHVFSSILVLLAGFTQFSAWFHKKYKSLHKKLGYVYVVNILMVTGPSSLLMGFYANGGLSSRIAFVLLAVLWMYFTAMALYKAIKKDLKDILFRSYEFRV